MKHYWVLICAIAVCLSFANADLCVDLQQDHSPVQVSEHIHKEAVPKAGQHAGTYTHGVVEGKNATMIIDCLMSCCNSKSCNVMFFYSRHCYLIACNRSVPDACDPVPRGGNPKFKDTYLIYVRTLEETAYLYDESNRPEHEESDIEVQSGSPADSSGVESHCEVDSNNGCGENEKCALVMDDDVISYVCECVTGYERVADSSICTLVYSSRDYSCEVGLTDPCLANEKCVSQSSRKRSGICECIDGYSRNDETYLCEEVVIDINDKSQDQTTAVTKKPSTTTTAVTEKPSIKDDSSEESKSTVTVTHTMPKETEPQTTTPLWTPLTVSVGENREITLPTDSVSLLADVTPIKEDDQLQYKWELIQQPEHKEGSVGEMVGMDTNNLHLSKLIAGLYTFKIAVTADGKYGESYVNVTVNPPMRINTPPVAVIKPTNQSVNQPNDVVLDGAQSTDDDKIVHYKWEQVSGPVETSGINDMDTDKTVLVLKGLNPGQYQFKLTVTDSDNKQNYTFANVTVIKEMDYPPKANAGSSVIINLPRNSATLYGNASMDDKGIVSYEWIKNAGDKLTSDMTGVRTPVLHLEHLEQGDYEFTLKVTDTAGQVGTSTVHVYVEAEVNKAPVAHGGLNQTIWFPQDFVTLDASNSSDDHKITSYKWSQISGPHCIMDNADRAVATVSKLSVGVYKFKVEIKDEEKLSASAVVFVTVKPDENKPPVADAGGLLVVTLPAPLVTIDGSASSDDRGIVSWEWKRKDESLAAGVIVNGTEHKPVLLLAGLVAGKYMFDLTVTDEAGKFNTATALLTVNPSPHKKDLLELQLDSSITSFMERNKVGLQNQLALLLHKSIPSADVHICELLEDKGSGNLLVIFYVSQKDNDKVEVIRGPQAAAMLRERLISQSKLLDYTALSIDTLICQNNCSGHGTCDQKTKKCICEAFWMQNPFKSYIQLENNCQWSILYVIIVTFITLVSMIGVIWTLVFICRRYYMRQPRRRHRYSLLSENDDVELSSKDEKDPKNKRRKRQYARTASDTKIGKVQNSSLMVSESDVSSDEETLFINKKANGIKNGFVRPGKTKVKA